MEPYLIPAHSDGWGHRHRTAEEGHAPGACTEQWALDTREALLELQRSYVEAGAGVLVTPTLGANRGWR